MGSIEPYLFQNMVPTGTGKPGKVGRHFPVRESQKFCQDWKSQGILLKILEKSEKIILDENAGKREICQSEIAKTL